MFSRRIVGWKTARTTHASLTVNAFRVLTDPNFLHQRDHAAVGDGLRTKWLHDPAVDLTELLPVDLVVL